MNNKKMRGKLRRAGAGDAADEYKLRASAEAGDGADITREQLVEAIHRLDPKVVEGDEYFDTALFMLGALYVGHDLDKLEKLTGVSREFIEPRADRLRRAGVWRANDKTACEWFDEGGGLSFWMDVAVALGLMNRGKGGAS